MQGVGCSNHPAPTILFFSSHVAEDGSLSHEPQTDRPAWVRFRVRGRVQGVGFRWFVRQAALRHGVSGDVANLRDGSVEIRAGGSERAIAALLSDVRRGPDGSRVDDVLRLIQQPLDGSGSFEIRHAE